MYLYDHIQIFHDLPLSIPSPPSHSPPLYSLPLLPLSSLPLLPLPPSLHRIQLMRVKC